MLHNPYSNHYHVIHNPPMPFNMDIPEGIVLDKQISIRGAITGDQVKINLASASGNIPFHFNPRIGQGCVVRNSKLGGWGVEEKDGPFTFQPNQDFEITITVTPDKYLVAVDGEQQFEFSHRCPFEEVNRLSIHSDARIDQITFSGGGRANPGEIRNPPTPFSVPVTNGLAPGRMIQVSGEVLADAAKFAINLQSGPEEYPNDIAFHFNPRYYDGDPYVCKNNRQGGTWGAEERDATNPIERAKPFHILIYCQDNEFNVAVNGVHFTSFARRNDFNDGNYLNIEGDVVLHAIRQFDDNTR